jgi:hypothetical protein
LLSPVWIDNASRWRCDSVVPALHFPGLCLLSPVIDGGSISLLDSVVPALPSPDYACYHMSLMEDRYRFQKVYFAHPTSVIDGRSISLLDSVVPTLPSPDYACYHLSLMEDRYGFSIALCPPSLPRTMLAITCH